GDAGEPVRRGQHDMLRAPARADGGGPLDHAPGHLDAMADDERDGVLRARGRDERGPGQVARRCIHPGGRLVATRPEDAAVDGTRIAVVAAPRAPGPGPA